MPRAPSRVHTEPAEAEIGIVDQGDGRRFVLDAVERDRGPKNSSRKAGLGSVTEAIERLVNRAKSRVRARVEHVFGVAKRLCGFSKVRDRGLARNAARSFIALGLDIYLARGELRGQVRP